MWIHSNYMKAWLRSTRHPLPECLVIASIDAAAAAEMERVLATEPAIESDPDPAPPVEDTYG